MRTFALLFFLAFLTACGGTTSRSNPAPPPPNIGGGPAGTPVTVLVSGGQTAGGANIVVPAAQASTAPNARLLGVAPLSGQGSASNTGASISRGATMRLLIFGPGLDDNTKVTVGGPADITISQVRAITSQNGTPGISAMAAVSSNAALGSRTVFLQNPQGDLSTFTGGLEVVP